jgi:hypothetical protein
MANCYFYDIIEPSPENLGSDVWLNVHQLMERPSWFGKYGSRYGFVSTLIHGNILAGFFANEGRKRGIQYTDDKKPLDPDAFYSFEHLFFAIFVDTSQLVLQQRNIYGYVNLGMGEMRDNFLELLATLLRFAGVGVVGTRVKIESAGEEYTQEELYSFFIENQTLRIEIKELDLTRIPNEDDRHYKLYNPKDDWHQITWGAVADTLKAGTQDVVFNASEVNPEAALNRGPLPKAFAAIGDIQEVVILGSLGNRIVRSRIRDEEITISIELEPENLPNAVEEVSRQIDTERRIDSWRERMAKRSRDNYKGTLFDNLS